MRHVSSATLVTIVLVSASSSLALAHIELQSPTARFVQDSNGVKTGMVTPLVAGQTVIVRWKESVSHSGHYRIALSAHESDFVEPTSLTVPTTLPAWDLADGIPDKTGTQDYMQTVQIPSLPCAACVLQLLQVMGAGADGTNSGPFSGVYHACADVAISAGGPDAATGADAAADSSTAPDLHEGKADASGGASGAGGTRGGAAVGGDMGSGGGGGGATGGTDNGRAGGGASGGASGGALTTGGNPTAGSDQGNTTGDKAGTTAGEHTSGGAAGSNAAGAGGATGHGGATSAGSGGNGTTSTNGSSSGCQFGKADGSSGQGSGWPMLALIAALLFAQRLRRRPLGELPHTRH